MLIPFQDDDTLCNGASSTLLPKKLVGGTFQYKDTVMPSCFYAVDSYDPQQYWNGLFKGIILVRILRYTLTGPKTFVTGPPNLGNATLDSFSPKADWTWEDGNFDYTKFFSLIVSISADEDLVDWSRETLAWLQSQGFDINNVNHIWLLQFLFLATINSQLTFSAQTWNQHRIQIHRGPNRSPTDMFVFDMFVNGDPPPAQPATTTMTTTTMTTTRTILLYNVVLVAHPPSLVIPPNVSQHTLLLSDELHAFMTARI
ncbi:hypothetical protein C8F01DRAFT_1246307 [Mycena amicta]|nr:hypothetical protein C8F01DRAFT_1246307 [Mycena amicta]